MENEKRCCNIKIQLPIDKCGKFNKNSEEIRDMNLTDEEFVTLARTGYLHKETDECISNIYLSVLDANTYAETRSNYIDGLIDTIIAEIDNDTPVEEFIINGMDICKMYEDEFPDGEVPFSCCVKFLLDFKQYNEIYEISVTLPPENS